MQTHCEIISYPTFARPYFTYFRVIERPRRTTRVYSYSDMPTLPASELGIPYDAVKKDLARFNYADRQKKGK